MALRSTFGEMKIRENVRKSQKKKYENDCKYATVATNLPKVVLWEIGLSDLMVNQGLLLFSS